MSTVERSRRKPIRESEYTHSASYWSLVRHNRVNIFPEVVNRGSPIIITVDPVTTGFCRG